MMIQDRLTNTFSALADPTRRAILARLALGEASVNELVEPFSLSQPAISKHLKVLERAGLITRGRQAQWRPCKLEGAALKDVADWLEPYRRLWEERFDRLEEHLRMLQSEPAKSADRTASAEQVKSTRQTKVKGKRHD
jgi:DNA-binding transcriptional ArsR family regulator